MINKLQYIIFVPIFLAKSSQSQDKRLRKQYKTLQEKEIKPEMFTFD